MAKITHHKKLYTALTAFIFAASALFANVELDINYYGVPMMDTYTVKNVEKLAHKSALGIDNYWGFYFLYPTNFLDIGISFGYGADFFRTVRMPTLSTATPFPAQNVSFNWATDIFLNIAPVIRYTINERHSFVMSFGMQFRMTLGEKTGTEDIALFAWQIDLPIHAGYRLWFLNKDKFHLGLSTGVHFVIPCGVVYAGEITRGGIAEEYEGWIRGGFGAKLSVGLCMNFGNRGWDKHK
ncbi:MAG: hypothetical protein IJ191_00290 [Treponema sp.]|nr:hypothetical protein [Treponema sp.]